MVSSAPLFVRVGIEKVFSGNGTDGFVRYKPTNESIKFRNKCAWPRTSLALTHNPSCELATYTGGLSVCHHGWYLLDAEQELPWPDQPLVYYKK